jgi:putative MFS transporter
MQPGNRHTLTHSLAFWLGTLAILAGVGCHLPDFIAARHVHFQMSGVCQAWGCGMSKLMCLGMGLIATGLAATVYGLFPAGHKRLDDASAAYELQSIDDAKLGAAHWKLVAVLGVALIVDVMKPATLGFVLPGVRHEYRISTSEASLLALCAMIGTTVGSLVWGMLADRLGRRGSILLASLMFIGTGICGTMPSFRWNLCMCFIMGLSAGGMLPIVFALLAEMIPARHRGWISVLIGGLGTVGGYLAASGSAAWLEPIFSWRILWLLNVPTGLLVILLNRFIPESPRYLLHEGRVNEARDTLTRFGISLVPAKPGATPDGVRTTVQFQQLFRQPYRLVTLAVCTYGVAWGLVNWGFLTWLPTILQDYLHLDGHIANRLLARSALIAVPGCLLVAWLYSRWSSKRSMVLFAAGTAAVLLAFSRLKAGDDPFIFSLLIILLLFGLGGMISMLSPYSVELYPTKLRATGGGVVASSSKVGGVIGPTTVAFVLSLFPGLMAASLLVATPLLVAAGVLWFQGKETTGKRLEEIR